MKRTLLCGVLPLLLSCTSQKRNSQTADTLAAKTPIGCTDSINSIENSITEESNDDGCVFNNDYEGLTIEWLKGLKITEFIWRDDLKQALVPNGQDTVFLQQGGCSHLEFMIELKLTDDPHAITDSAYWIAKP
jgi:hypothetical protein